MLPASGAAAMAAAAGAASEAAAMAAAAVGGLQARADKVRAPKDVKDL